MFGVVATLRVKDGKGPEFEAAMRELQKQVKANEPDCAIYEIMKSKSDPLAYRALEAYRTEAALELHKGTPHMQAALGALQACLDGRPQIDYLESF